MPVPASGRDNQSLSSQRGTIRGLHFQLAPEPQTKLVRVLAGSVFDVAVDLRRGSPSYGRWCAATLKWIRLYSSLRTIRD